MSDTVGPDPREKESSRRSELQKIALLFNGKDRLSGRVAVYLAIALHLVVISITIPSWSRSEEAVKIVSPPPSLIRPVLPPPPPLEKPQKPVVDAPDAHKIPVPDPTPMEPEPVRDPAMDPGPEDVTFLHVLVDPTLIAGPPEAPPSLPSILLSGHDGVTNPVKIFSVRPRYPNLARRAHIEGKIVLRAVIHADGTVGELEIVQSPGAKFGFDEAAVQAVRQWRFKPALQNGRPVDVYFQVVVTFSLED